MPRSVIFVALLFAAACDERDVKHMTALKNDVCACKTSACARTAMDAVPAAKIKSTHRTQALAQEMMGCLAKLDEAERAPSDPDEEATPPSTPPESAGSASR